jgi:preprotein translocase subunit SecY
VLGIFAITRILANIPIMGVNQENLNRFFGQFQAFGFYNLLSGGTLEKFSLIMLGLGPYITATIILQLLTMIFPQLEKLYKEEGEAGRQKFNQWGRMMTVPLAIVQSYAMLLLLSRQQVIGALSPMMMVSAIITTTAGTLFLMWLGELISEKGIGNGVSLLIFAGIVSDFPNNIMQIIATWDPSAIPGYLLFFAMSLVIISGVVLITSARRNIQVSYAKRVRGNKVYGGVSTYLPLNVNPAGVIPIIFALSILLFPGLIANFFASGTGAIANIAKGAADFFQNGWIYGIMYFILVIIFTYFYTAVTFDPKAISTNLQKMGGFVPGIRPGRSTAQFLYYVLNRILLIGALFLGIIAILPSIIGGITGVTVFGFFIGGTSLLIVVSVALETMQQIKAHLQMREYEGF